MKSPVKCAECSRPATRICTIEMNGMPYDVPLCDECALRHEQNYPYNGYRQNEPTCPVCGTRLSDVVNSQYVGCSECYNVFRSVVLTKINNRYGTRKHLGKRLKEERPRKFINLDDMENMREQYHLAIEEGRKEDAEEIYEYLRRGGNSNE